jgi:hypothetical protein
MERIKITERIKIGASLLLLACFLLPFSSCTRHLDEDGKLTYISKKPAVKAITEYTYPWEGLNLKEVSDWLFLLCFVWPIPILIHRYRSGGRRIKLIFWILEPVFLSGSSYYIYFLSNFFGKPAIGAYLMHTANFFYGTAWISETTTKIKQRRKNKNLTKQS